ncbi:MAG: fructosamine kinase family protein [Flavobacteriales bacterium]|nr:fructosamine kinase family protein [Flavobacteriales bacterium]
MSLPGPLAEQLSDHLSGYCGRPVDIEHEVPVGGGSINDAYRLDTDAGRFFVKVNSTDCSPGMFAAEADGLGHLRGAGAIRVPAVIATGEDHDHSFILLEWVEGGLRTDPFWTTFGRSLAALHRHTATSFGLDHSNYIGTLKQVNTPYERWADFFITCRIEPQVKMARDRKRIGDGDVLRFERLYTKLGHLFPQEPPALLHGDLWSGNFMCDAQSCPVLIDPAVYHGHREMDIAMTKLFGGSEEGFYTAYNEAWPLEQGWKERVDLCNLYPLLVHVNLFGAAYPAQVHAILTRHV